MLECPASAGSNTYLKTKGFHLVQLKLNTPRDLDQDKSKLQGSFRFFQEG
jgi:hypothetical protein